MSLSGRQRAWRCQAFLGLPALRRAALAGALVLLGGCGFFDEEPTSEPAVVRVDQTWDLVGEMGGRDGRFGSYVPKSLVSVYEDQREAILLQQGFEVVFRHTPVFEDARLEVDVAVPSEHWAKLTGPVRFRVLVDDGERQEILRRDLDPSHVDADRGWIPLEVALPARLPVGSEVAIVLAAEGPDRELGRIAAWNRPHVRSRGRLIELDDEQLLGTEIVTDLLSDALEKYHPEAVNEEKEDTEGSSPEPPEGVEAFDLKLPLEPGDIPSLRIQVGARLDFEDVELPERPLLEVELFAIGTKIDPSGELVYRLTMQAAGREEIVAVRRLDAGELRRREFGFRTLRETLPLPILTDRATLSVEVGGSALDHQILTGVSRFRVLEEKRYPAREPGSKPNVLVLLVDTLRADHLGCYGYERDTSPFLDRLAGRGVLFRNGIAQSSWTLPSTASLLSGLYPQTHGSLEGATIRLATGFPTLPGLLLERGVATGGFAANFIVSEKNGFDRGFQVLEELFLDPAEQVNEAVVEWIRRQAGRPFFGYVHYFDPHSPYAPPEPYATWFSDGVDEQRARDVALRWSRLEEEIPFYTLLDWKVAPQVEGDFRVDKEKRELILSEWLVQHWIDRYDGEIRYWDAQLERFVGQLEELGALENTWLIITSDHGEAFGEHAFFGHGENLHDELIRVPFLIVPPGRQPARIVDEPVELVDILPTVMAIYDLPAPTLPGQVLPPLGRQERASSGFAFVRGKALESDDVVTIERAAVRSTTHKAMTDLDEDTWQIYDLRRDPGEHEPLATDDQPEVQQSLRDQLLRWHETTPRGMRENVDSLAPEIRQKLIELGYVAQISPSRRKKDREEKREDEENEYK